tara:strand:+ start:1258 stop:2091 length:834 start_codon:yes stop_codon:yes gene_type:complete
MIIWLASYPKSGNTLLRSILGAYFFSKDGNFNFEDLYKIGQFPSFRFFKDLNIDINNEKEIFSNYIKAQNLLNKSSKNVNFLKTHAALAKLENCNFTDPSNTLGAIYIVRDPRNVATSFSHHYQMNIDSVVEAMSDENSNLPKNKNLPTTFISSWNSNYNSWKALGDRTLLIKYEELTKFKKETLIKIFNFFEKLGMKKKLDISKLDKIIETTEFTKMQKLEREKKFTESIIDNKTGKKKPFFNLGPKNDWKKILDDRNVKNIEEYFHKEMKELGYL